MFSLSVFKHLLGRQQVERRQYPRLRAPFGTCVMVVDNLPTARTMLARLLVQDGYAVLFAASGEQALELARDEQPALIFLDIVLPAMNGFTVLRTLRHDERTRDIPVVVVSGNEQATEQFYVRRFGADSFLKKPFGRGEVFGCIRQLVESGRLPARQKNARSAVKVAVR